MIEVPEVDGSAKIGFGHPNCALATNKFRDFTSIQGILQ